MTGSLVRGRVARDLTLVEADSPLADLNARAGGCLGAPIAVPQIAALARLARRLNIVISRSVIAADGDEDLDLWVRAKPDVDGVELAITGWHQRSQRSHAVASDGEREADFLRADADWTWETDSSLRISALSSGAAAALGKSEAELIGRQLTRLFRLEEEPEGALPILEALADRRRFLDQPAELRRRGRDRLRFLLSGVPLIDGEGQFAGFRGAARRTDPAPTAAASMEQRADASAFGERLDQALREPLDQIIASAEAIHEQPEGPLRRDYTGYARDIASAGRHLLELVDDLVDLHAIERPDFSPDIEDIDLADLARRAAGLLAVRASGRNVRIDRPADDEELPARGEFRRVLQILMNLITNAIRYSPDGGMIWIRTEREEDLACVVVADQGKGIAAEDQSRIFDKFERVDPSEPGGTGLGLYIARRLARAMGGDIAVDSEPGQGARFTLTLPSRR